MPEIIFQRKIYQQMLQWKRDFDGNTALLIQGARRIGKSTIAEEFAKKEYAAYILIDFSNAASGVKELFDDVSDIDFFFLRLQALYKTSLVPRKSVIIFDEVQLCPKARQAIKHLVKDHRYDYIETGSLLSIKKNVKDILIPSEETRISMYPMDFEEFLWAIDKKPTYDVIRYSYENMKPLGNATHRAVMKDFRLYMLVGGMPQAILAYLKYNDFSKVDAAKRTILDLYMEDFRKIDASGRAARLFQAIPSELTRNARRYQVGSVINNTSASKIEGTLMDMADSLTVNFAYHSSDPNVGLPLSADYNFFKLFLCDTGLFVTLAFMDKKYTENDIYQKLLSDKLSADLGYVYENVVAQMLRAAGDNLFYYTFKAEVLPTTVNQPTYEIDFLISRSNKICPLEVKSSGYKSHKSLDKFQEKYSARISHRYLLYTKDLSKDQDIICLPVYMTGLV